jgi:hypothetical protein
MKQNEKNNNIYFNNIDIKLSFPRKLLKAEYHLSINKVKTTTNIFTKLSTLVIFITILFLFSYTSKIHFCQQIIAIFISHNVTAVYDVFAARIRALRSKDQGCKNVAEFWRGNKA